MTEKELNKVVEIIENNMTTIHDRPLGSNPRWVLTTLGLSQVKKELKELVKE